jgi:hypothetical protein
MDTGFSSAAKPVRNAAHGERGGGIDDDESRASRRCWVLSVVVAAGQCGLGLEVCWGPVTDPAGDLPDVHRGDLGPTGPGGETLARMGKMGKMGCSGYCVPLLRWTYWEVPMRWVWDGRDGMESPLMGDVWGVRRDGIASLGTYVLQQPH